MLNVPTPHNDAQKGQIAKTVLMPGDPLRAKMIAENFLEKPVRFNAVRDALGYTGTWQGVPISVMSSGMGCPSIGIYAYELYHGYGVENILRVGSAGALQDDLKVGDLVLAQGACTDSNFAAQYNLPGVFAPIASYDLLAIAVHCAELCGIPARVGNVVTTDFFYNADSTAPERWRDMGVLCTEMETAALYMAAAYAGKRALSLLEISDHMFRHESMSALQRQNDLTDMILTALDTAAAL